MPTYSHNKESNIRPIVLLLNCVPLSVLPHPGDIMDDSLRSGNLLANSMFSMPFFKYFNILITIISHPPLQTRPTIPTRVAVGCTQFECISHFFLNAPHLLPHIFFMNIHRPILTFLIVLLIPYRRIRSTNDNR